MNRLLLTAAAAMTMAVSSHASAASITLDTMTDGNYFWSGDGASQIANYGGGDFARSASYTANYTNEFDTTPESWVVFGAPTEADAFFDIANADGVSASVELHYNISSLFGQVAPGTKAVTFTVIAGPSALSGPTSITVKQNGSLLGTWNASIAIPGGDPGYKETSTFTLDALTGSDDLAFYVEGSDGYDLSVNQFALVDVLPVPEPGEWAMMVVGLGVVAAAASRRRAVR